MAVKQEVVDDIKSRQMNIAKRSLDKSLVVKCKFGHVYNGYDDIAVEPIIPQGENLPCSKCGNTFTLECASCMRIEMEALRTRIAVLERFMDVHLAYAPGGTGYSKAGSEFVSLASSSVTTTKTTTTHHTPV